MDAWNRISLDICYGASGTFSRRERSGMGKTYYRDFYGRLREERRAGHGSSVPAKWALITLVMLVGLVVIASMMH